MNGIGIRKRDNDINFINDHLLILEKINWAIDVKKSAMNRKKYALILCSAINNNNSNNNHHTTNKVKNTNFRM